MRLFKVAVVAVALLDAAMFLQSPSSPLSATSPAQVVGYTTADSTGSDVFSTVASSSRP